MHCMKACVGRISFWNSKAVCSRLFLALWQLNLRGQPLMQFGGFRFSKWMKCNLQFDLAIAGSIGGAVRKWWIVQIRG